MELTSEKSCCSAGNNQVDEQAGITQHRWQLSRRCPELLHFSCILAEISTKPENHFSNDQSFAYLNCTVMPEPISAAHMKNDTQPL